MEQRTTITIVTLICLVLGLGIYTYMQHSELKELHDLTFELNNKNNNQDEEIKNNENIIGRLEIEAEFNNKRIVQFESTILDKNREISQRENKIRELEQEKNQLTRELSVIATTGTTPKTKEFILKLTETLESERKKLAQLNEERNNIAEKYNVLQREKIDIEEELSILKRNVIPSLENKNAILRNNLETANRSMALMNVRASIRELDADPKNNRFSFEMIIDEIDLQKIKKSGLQEIRLIPSIKNKSSDIVYVQSQRGEIDRLYIRNVSDLSQVERFTYLVDNPSISNSYRNKKSVNYVRGDEMILVIVIPELNNLEIARHEFRMR